LSVYQELWNYSWVRVRTSAVLLNLYEVLLLQIVHSCPVMHVKGTCTLDFNICVLQALGLSAGIRIVNWIPSWDYK
jgi:hypothetical protein